MNRNNVIIGLFVLFILPSLAKAQQNSFSQNNQDGNGRSTASLTTTDLLNPQDFAPKVSEEPARRSRIVGAVRKNKKGEVVSVLPAAGTGNGVASKNVPNQTETMAQMMTPTRRRIESEVEPSVVQSSTSSTGDSHLDTMIAEAALRNGIDHKLILAVMKQESSYNSQATSPKGARGLMQLMPATAYRFGVRDIYDPAQNIEGGARYLRFLLDTFNGDVELALAGYNAGENAVARYGNRIPPYRETQDYVRKITAHYSRLSNGTALNRSSATSGAVKKAPEAEVVTSRQTMTQY